MTRDAFLEMIELDRLIQGVTEYSDSTKNKGDGVITRPKEGRLIKLIDVCDNE